MSEATAPPVRIEADRGEVVIGPWPDFQGDYTALKVRDLTAFIEALQAVADSLRTSPTVEAPTSDESL
jgi:hypothetical protein